MKRPGIFLLFLALFLVPFAVSRIMPTLTGRAAAARDATSSNSTRIRLAGYVPEVVRDGRASRISATDPAETIVVGLSMHLRDEAGLNALVDDVSDPGSPSHRSPSMSPDSSRTSPVSIRCQ
jgi:hypothetical protein